MIEVKIRRFAGAQKKPAENLPEQPASFTKNLIRNKRRTGQKQTRCFWPVWRSKRDLNPRGTFAPYALSRGVFDCRIDTTLARHVDDAEFLRWAALKLAMLERALNDRK